MKCPFCDAETKTNPCEYCYSQIPPEKATINIVNNYYGTPPQNTQVPTPADPPAQEPPAPPVQEPPAPPVQEPPAQKPQDGYGYSSDPTTPYSFNTSPVKYETPVEEPQRRTWLWVLGWIFMFPVPLTILLLRKKDMHPVLKYGLIALGWIVYLLLAQ